MYEIFINSSDTPNSTDPHDWRMLVQTGLFGGEAPLCAELKKDGGRIALWDRGALVCDVSLDDIDPLV